MRDLFRDWAGISARGAGLRDLFLDASVAPGAWALAAYRAARELGQLPAPLAAPLRLLMMPWRTLIAAATSVQLAEGAEIGGGLCLPQPARVRVAAGARLGRDVQLCRGASIEANAAGAPFLGDRVYVGPGARVRGPVRVGNDVAIAAHSLVVHDVADGAVVGGEQATVLSLRGSHALVHRGRTPRGFGEAARGALRRALPRPFQLLLRP